MRPDESAFQESRTEPEREREQAFMAWLQAGRLPEIKPGVQQRSARTAYALLESGAALMRERALDALSIEEICNGAGATVGAFYGRFEDKMGFFAALQRLTCLRSEAALDAFMQQHPAEGGTLEELCHAMVAMTVQRYRANVGVYRAALKHSDEGAWEPFRRLGDLYRQRLVELLSPHLPTLDGPARALRIRFAYQVMVGTLVHATLNAPGPVQLGDPAMIDELAGLVLGYLRSPG